VGAFSAGGYRTVARTKPRDSKNCANFSHFSEKAPRATFSHHSHAPIISPSWQLKSLFIMDIIIN
jgi:hypothetical protein